MDTSTRDAIARVAREEGIDPAYALATAERESRFDPNSGGKGTIRGLFQLTGANRRAYGQADDAGVEDQTRAFARFTKGVRAEMQKRLGRAPTWDETYLGHYIGGTRAAHVAAGGQPAFSARELADNPELSKPGLLARVTGDMAKRRSRFGGADAMAQAGPVDFAQFGQGDDDPNGPQRAAPVPGAVDFSAFGAPEQKNAPGDNKMPAPAAAGLDFAQFGQPHDAEKGTQGPTQANPRKAPPASSGLHNQPGEEIDMAQFGQPEKIAMPVPSSKQPKTGAPSPGELLNDIDAEMLVRQNSPDPGDTAFQGTLQKLQPQPQSI